MSDITNHISTQWREFCCNIAGRELPINTIGYEGGVFCIAHESDAPIECLDGVVVRRLELTFSNMPEGHAWN